MPAASIVVQKSRVVVQQRHVRRSLVTTIEIRPNRHEIRPQVAVGAICNKHAGSMRKLESRPRSWYIKSTDVYTAKPPFLLVRPLPCAGSRIFAAPGTESSHDANHATCRPNLPHVRLASDCSLFNLLLAAFVACIATSALAQEYRTDPIDENAKKNGYKGSGVKDPAVYSADKAIFDEYFQKAYFPSMTHPTSEGLAELGRLRSDLFSKYLRETSNQQFQTNLSKMAYDAMLKVAANMEQLNPPQVADPPYHPAVRYNAILIVGMLDEKYAADGTPKPYPAATKVMTLIVDWRHHQRSLSTARSFSAPDRAEERTPSIAIRWTRRPPLQ